MFVISQSPTFKQVVKFTLLSEKGTPIKHAYTAIFKRPTREEMEQIAKDVNTLDETTGQVKTSDLALMKEWMVGFEGVQELDEDKKPVAVEFSAETQLALFATLNVLPATVQAFFDGAKGAQAKNS